METTHGSSDSRLHQVRYVITFGVEDSITVPATTPSLEMALEIALVVSEHLPQLRPELESSDVRVWRYPDGDVEGHSDPTARGELIALFAAGRGVE